MRTLCAAVLSIALSGPCAAQAVPDAPAPSGLSLTPPSPSYTPVAPAAPPPKRKLVCGAEPDGPYILKNTEVPDALRGQLSAYNTNVRARVGREWIARFNKIHKGFGEHLVQLRLAIRPDGTYFDPEITIPSGSPGADAGALNAIRALGPFPPMPEGIDHPVVVCFCFGYNMHADELRGNEPWLDKAVDKRSEQR